LDLNPNGISNGGYSTIASGVLLCAQSALPIAHPSGDLTLLHPNSVISTPHYVTHSLISQNPRERMVVVQMSLLIVTFLSLISRILSVLQTTKEVNPRLHIAPCFNMWSVTFVFLFFFF
jgi:hypothetical protein